MHIIYRYIHEYREREILMVMITIIITVAGERRGRATYGSSMCD